MELQNLGKFHILTKRHAIITFMASQMTSKEDNAEMMKAFSALDTDGNGVLSRDELITGYQKLNKEATTGEIFELVDDLMAQVDVNHEGR